MRDSIILMTCLLWACQAGDQPRPETVVTSCHRRAEGSRWAGDGAVYHVAQEYGREPGEELADPWGSTTTRSGDILVFDAGQSRVLHLDEKLQPVGTYGREGTGPGEFVYQRALHGDWLTATDTTFVVLDYRGVSEFTLDGDFNRYVSRAIPFTDLVQGIESSDGGIVYALDIIDREDGSRVLETWLLGSAGSRRLIRTDMMPDLPRWQGDLVRGEFADQGEPLWAARGSCAFVSDGSSPWVLRMDLRSGLADTVEAPILERPERSPEDRQRRERRRRSARAVGINAGSDRMEPTALIRWADMIVDPDGFVWLEPWRPFSLRTSPVTAIVIDPLDGSVRRVELEVFPDGFLPDGGIVALSFDREASIPLVLRLERQQARESSP